MIGHPGVRTNWHHDLSIIIVNYNTRNILRQCLRSICNQDHGISLEAVVVDNASRDGSASMVRKEFPRVKLLENERNLGFSAGNNRGLPVCEGEFVLLLNSDTLLLPGTLARVLAFARAHPESGILGCKLVRPNSELDWACRRGFPTPLVALFKFLGFHRLFPRSRLFGRYNITYKDPNLTYEVDSVVGAFMLISRGVLEQVGGLDENFFMYGEDLDLCFRAKKAGFRVYYLGQSQVVHIKGASSRKESFRMNYHFHRAMILFHRKHLRHQYPGAVNAATYVGIGLRFSALVIKHYIMALLGAIQSRLPLFRMDTRGESSVPAGGEVVL